MIDFLIYGINFIGGLLLSGFGLIIGLIGIKIMQTGIGWCF